MHRNIDGVVNAIISSALTHKEASDELARFFEQDIESRSAALELLRQKVQLLHTPKQVKRVSTAPRKAKITVARGLSDADWEMIQRLEPALVMQMMRNRYRVTSMAAPGTWLDANCTGFYYLEGSRILFEKEEDAVLFRMRFEGSQS